MTQTERAGSKLTIPNSNVGKESISQTISTLECWRLNHAHEYQAVPKMQTGLRLNARVKTIERAKRHNEPKQVESLQALKVTGSSSGEPVFTPVECWATLTTSPSSPSPPLPLRHVHRGGACPMCHLVPADVFRHTACLCQASRRGHAPLLDHDGCAQGQLPDPPLV